MGGIGGQSASASLEGFLQEDGEEEGGGPYSSQLIGKNGSMNRNGNYTAGGSVKHQEQEHPHNGGASEDSDSDSDREGNSNHNLSSTNKVSSLANRIGGKTGLKTTKLVKKKSPA
jgi:hypothetical protein